MGWGSAPGTPQNSELVLCVGVDLPYQYQELWAVRLACQAFQTNLQGKCISVLTDNTRAMFYINKQGGAHSPHLCQEALTLWEYCIAHSSHLEAFYLPGSQNTLADHLSRSFVSHHEWSFYPNVLNMVFQRGDFPRLTCLWPSSTKNALSFVNTWATDKALFRMPPSYFGWGSPSMVSLLRR